MGIVLISMSVGPSLGQWYIVSQASPLPSAAPSIGTWKAVGAAEGSGLAQG